MAKTKYVYVCSECGTSSSGWMGKCPGCGSWNTMVAESTGDPVPVNKRIAMVSTGNKPTPIPTVPTQDVERFVLDMPELDTVLGGGLVPGSLVLLGGEPGIGKSTILLQVAAVMGKKYGDVLYVSGEESAHQVRMRAERLGALIPQVLLLNENNMDNVMMEARTVPHKLLILDSIQSVFLPDLPSVPGSITQVRAITHTLMQYAKENNIPVVIVGHVTKEGTLAGPRLLEHMVDTVLYFEGERYQSFRLLRAVKNRFGSTNEIGVFEMQEDGLQHFSDPSSVFLSQRPEQACGTTVTCVMQGTRPILLEVQALTTPTFFGNPRRLGVGIDYNRLAIILAVLEKKLGLALSGQDVYVNMAGGLRVDDPAVDLAVAAAIASSFRDRPIDKRTMIMGEIGLVGEARAVAQPERRMKEAAKFAFDKCVYSQSSSVGKKQLPLDAIAVKDVYQSFKALELL